MNLDFQTVASLASVAIPFIVFAMTQLYKRLGKIEERQYDMKGELVTKAELQQTEDRITSNIGTKVDVLIALLKPTRE